MANNNCDKGHFNAPSPLVVNGVSTRSGGFRHHSLRHPRLEIKGHMKAIFNSGCNTLRGSGAIEHENLVVVNVGLSKHGSSNNIIITKTSKKLKIARPRTAGPSNQQIMFNKQMTNASTQKYLYRKPSVTDFHSRASSMSPSPRDIHPGPIGIDDGTLPDSSRDAPN